MKKVKLEIKKIKDYKIKDKYNTNYNYTYIIISKQNNNKKIKSKKMKNLDLINGKVKEVLEFEMENLSDDIIILVYTYDFLINTFIGGAKLKLNFVNSEIKDIWLDFGKGLLNFDISLLNENNIENNEVIQENNIKNDNIFQKIEKHKSIENNLSENNFIHSHENNYINNENIENEVNPIQNNIENVNTINEIENIIINDEENISINNENIGIEENIAINEENIEENIFKIQNEISDNETIQKNEIMNIFEINNEMNGNSIQNDENNLYKIDEENN
jgi:hypothetical protein